MTRITRVLAFVALVAVLAACSRGGSREFARYYDPEGHFATDLPAADDLTLTPPTASPDGPAILTGVVATPPAPSPAAEGAFSGFDPAQQQPSDQTIYQAIAVETDAFADLGEMGLYFLTGDPAIDLIEDEPARLDGREARLIVADVTQGEDVTASLAVAMSLGEGGTGYLVAAIFPPGEWDAERDDFMTVLDSFEAGVPPGLATFPSSDVAA